MYEIPRALRYISIELAHCICHNDLLLTALNEEMEARGWDTTDDDFFERTMLEFGHEFGFDSAGRKIWLGIGLLSDRDDADGLYP